MGNLVNRISKRPISTVAAGVEMTESESEEKPKIIRHNLTAKRGKNDPDECDISPRSKLKAKRCSKKIRKSMQNISLTEEKEGQDAKLVKRHVEFPKKEQHLICFLRLFGKLAIIYHLVL